MNVASMTSPISADLRYVLPLLALVIHMEYQKTQGKFCLDS